MDNLDYGIVGNGHSAALISKEGSIDWLCLPNFESPSVFAKILDKDKGGFCSIVPEGKYEVHQEYVRKTNILCTTFVCESGSFKVIDFMPRYVDDKGTYHMPSDVVRLFYPISGTPCFKVLYHPQMNYAEYPTEKKINHHYIKAFSTDGVYESMYCYTSFPLEDVYKEETLVLDQPQYVLISYNQKIEPVSIDHVEFSFERTKVYWMGWSSKMPTVSHYAKELSRSALVLKLLAFHKTGAILAAATTSLPETIGEVRNWDYRFCWIRDAAMTVRVLNRLGHENVSRRFIEFILNVLPYKDERIQIMYGIHGQKDLVEQELSWLSGYENSSPVRIGNDAYHQKQHDIYGFLLDMIYEYFHFYSTTTHNREEIWTVVRSLVRHIIDHWQNPDNSIWEFRTDQKHYTFSKVLSWVALDRGVRIAKLLKVNDYVEEWEELAETIRQNVLQHGWNEDLQSFTQAYQDDNYDAANLLMADYDFIDPMDPRYVSTVEKTYEQLCKDGLMYRYINKDDFGVPQSSFTVCTFWMIKSLYLIGKKKEAKALFDQLLSYSNHLGLFSEDLDMKTKRLLGNFPQAYSHLALIDVALLFNENGNNGIK